MTSDLASGDLTGGSEMNIQLCDRSRVFGGSVVKTGARGAACGVTREASCDFKDEMESSGVAWRLQLASFMWKRRFKPPWQQTSALPTTQRARHRLAYQFAALQLNSASLRERAGETSDFCTQESMEFHKKQQFSAMLICTCSVIQLNDLLGINTDKLT